MNCHMSSQMNKQETMRFFGVTVAAKAACCTLAVLVTSGAIAAGTAWLAGSITLVLVTGAVATFLIVSHRSSRGMHRSSCGMCCAPKAPIPETTTEHDWIET